LTLGRWNQFPSFGLKNTASQQEDSGVSPVSGGYCVNYDDPLFFTVYNITVSTAKQWFY